MTPYKNEAELLAIIELFSNLHPLIQGYIPRGGKYENKWPSLSNFAGASGKKENVIPIPWSRD
jgi:hypothetical protein